MREAIKDISYLMTNIPDFINTTSFTDHAAWNIIYDMNNIILDLIQVNFLSDRVIFKKYLLFNEKYNELVDLPYIDKIDLYFKHIIRYAEKRCIEEELYEAATNIRKFTEI